KSFKVSMIHRLRFTTDVQLGHAIFKLTYLSNHDYKHLYFESDAATVNEIVLKVNYILESRASTARADYFAQKQRKLNRRTSFSFQKEKKSGQQ
ncbi:MAPKAP1 isoform 18, partial [Pan troglodytes]